MAKRLPESIVAGVYALWPILAAMHRAASEEEMTQHMDQARAQLESVLTNLAGAVRWQFAENAKGPRGPGRPRKWTVDPAPRPTPDTHAAEIQQRPPPPPAQAYPMGPRPPGRGLFDGLPPSRPEPLE